MEMEMGEPAGEPASPPLWGQIAGRGRSRVARGGRVGVFQLAVVAGNLIKSRNSDLAPDYRFGERSPAATAASYSFHRFRF